MWIGLLVLGGVLGLAATGHTLLRARWTGRLRAYPAPRNETGSLADGVAFSYQSADAPPLQELRGTYRLDQVAGQGNEFEQQLALMRWVHRLTKHAVNPSQPEQIHALHLIPLCQDEGKRINCWMFATILTEVYLAMGYPARLVHLLPVNEKPKESHFVTAVYSTQFEKWIMIDPDTMGYVTDEAGTPLGVHEIRERLADRSPLRVNGDIDLYCGRLPFRRLRRAAYKTYLAKNMVRYYASVHSVFDLWSKSGGRTFIEWLPQGYRSASDDAPRRTRQGDTVLATRSVKEFWPIPESAQEVEHVLDTPRGSA